MTEVATALVSTEGEAVQTDVVKALRGQLTEAPALVMAFAATPHPLGPLASKLSGEFPAAQVLCCSTAGEFTEQRDAKGAISAVAISGDYKVFSGMGTGLREDPAAAISKAVEGLPAELHGYPHRTAILLVDPLAGNGEQASLIAASLLGDDVTLAGGAAGDDLKMEEAFVGCGSQVASDAAVVALLFSKKPLGIGVCHGHQPVSQELTVTRAEGNVVYEIDGEPAWEVWLRNTRNAANDQGIDVDNLSADDEGGYLLRYEAGLANGEQWKIRAPLSRDDTGAVHFACGIPEGTEFRITESIAERQISSAREAARRARAQLSGAEPAGAIVFDCICRNLILGDDFQKAVSGMSEELGGAPVAGFETYGEIALNAGDMSGFHNTTSVVLAFPR